jgi:DNA-binding NtrC family response regulator
MGKPEGTRRRTRPYYVTGGTLRLSDGRSIPVGDQPLTIGRDKAADVCLDDPEVSALHCELWASPRGVVVRDLDSTNGTRLGHAAVSEAVLHGRCTLRIGANDVEFEPAAAPQRIDDPSELESFGPLVGSSRAMRQLYRQLGTVARTDLTVLLTGDPGTGKELVARALHGASDRHARPFVALDCGALPVRRAEAVLFGHEKGAFDGAGERKAGAFLEAAGGTLFLEDVGELTDTLQTKLLRAVSERIVKRVGGDTPESIDVRVVSATRRDLRREMNAERFRDDLYYRLAQVRLELVPLRKRRGDIPALVAAACERLNQGAAAERVSNYIDERFRNYDWPGNVAELVNVASVLASIGDADAEQVLAAEARDAVDRSTASAQRFAHAKRRFEEDYFRQLLDATDGNISEISRRCGLARHQVRRHLRKLGLLS